MSRLRSTAVILTSAFIIPAVTACSSDQDTSVDTTEACMETATGLRDDDEDCDSGSSGHSWVYFHGYAPAVGHPIPHGYSTVKTGIVGRAPTGGGKAVSSGG